MHGQGPSLERCEDRGGYEWTVLQASRTHLSYAALIAYESHFAIAKEKKLIPVEITRLAWRHFVRELLGGDSANRLYSHGVAPRFVYGELRLNRLNLIFFALHFVATWQSFGSFFRDNSAWIISFTAYVILVLSAAQVGLSTNILAESDGFQACCGARVTDRFLCRTVGVQCDADKAV